MSRVTSRPRDFQQQAGFTLVELMVVVVIIAVLFVFSAINLGQSRATVSLATTVDTMLADIKSQQLLAMVGDSGSVGTRQPHGVYVQSNQYTLYANSTYSAGDSANYVIAAPTNITFSTTFPSGKLLFNTGDGSVNGFTSGSNTISLSGYGSSKTITVNRFGATTVN